MNGKRFKTIYTKKVDAIRVKNNLIMTIANSNRKRLKNEGGEKDANCIDA